ncbi:Concanavalin A-like lectin/glucanase, subgroup [Metarhizium rileyi]|uniref:Alpha-L-arabinofuranosidase n=1 Tax=Metarhizium rileyi (strain RCEF 4871) TaxID=1649241 RepID=A0A166WJ44_METRR|nr:Concanavalin A-like lectin/glucanase, subgroup [Metarhizium rileyi RCEF 4871]
MRGVSLQLLLVLASQVSGTSFLNHEELLAGVEDGNWFERNIPLLDIPNQQMQDVYYYRWQTYKEHLVYTGAQYGYMSSEFLQPVSYGAPYGGIVAAAGHHINEGRWVRDIKYGQDVVNYWLAGPGQLPKPMTDNVNKDTSDWAHEYSFWAASSVWGQYLVTGDRDFVVGHLDNLVKQYRGWDSHYDTDLGLYWQVPVWDATEYTAASYESKDPYHGGAGFRPTMNSYQYGDARAISSIAALEGNTSLAEEYKKRAERLQDALQRHLWDNETSFYKHRARDDNPSGSLLTTRESMGYIPWIFGVPNLDSHMAAFAQLGDAEGFASRFGPTTTERRSRWFMHEAQDCCRWDGPAWPYSTSQTLTSVENVLNDYPSQNYITVSDYFRLLQQYASMQFKDGKPYVAEAHDPDTDGWMYDGHNHSEDYNHSTFVDNIIAGLIGLRARPDDSLVVNPLAPSSWDYFCLENVAYHGHSITVLWDSTGSHYGRGKGLRVYVNDELAGSRDTLGSVRVDVGPVSRPAIIRPLPSVNIAANGQRFPQLTQAFASYTFDVDDASRAIDGIVWRTGIPQNSRWTSYNSPNSQDHVGVDLRRNQVVSDVRLFFYDDGNGVRIPSSYDLQYWTGSSRSWKTVPGQQRSEMPTTSNAETKITFPVITTSQLRVVAPNPGPGRGWGLSEFEVWSPANVTFQIRNDNSGKLMSAAANSANVQQHEDKGSRDQLWQLVPGPGGWWKVKNLNSGLVLAVQNASTANSAQLQQQHEEDGGDEHLWRVESQGRGLFFLRNKNSRKLAGVDGMSSADSANVVQYEDNGTRDHLWSLLPAVPEEPSINTADVLCPLVPTVNRLSISDAVYRPQRYLEMLIDVSAVLRRAAQHGFLVALSLHLVAAGPCDIYESHKTPCIAAHSTTRALYDNYSGGLYQVRRGSDLKTTDIAPISAGQVADAAAQDSFCAHTTCLITVIYDQSGRGNHLTQAPPGGAGKGPEANGFDTLSSAVGAPVKLNGKKAYGVFISPTAGYRNNAAVGTASEEQPQGIYAVFDGTHYSTYCCFDYGNAERNNMDTGRGKMEALYFGIGGYKGAGNGPWVQADIEDGIYAGQSSDRNNQNPSMSSRFVTAILKGEAGRFALRGGNSTSGSLSTFYSGKRPAGYETMRKEGAIVLGIGGDNSNRGQGTFYEGAMLSGYPSDEAEAKVQDNIVNAAKYAATSLVSGPGFTVNSHVSLRATTACCTTRYIAHSGSSIKTQVVSSSSSPELKRQSSWIVRTGLGFNGCYSFESVDSPGKFIRLSKDYRLVLEANDGTKLFHEYATFCPEAGLDGKGSSLRSWNHPARYWRHYNNDLYAASNGSPFYFDAHWLFNQDVTFEASNGFA